MLQLRDTLDSEAVCQCIAMGEEQLAWSENVYFEDLLIIPKGSVINLELIESFHDEMIKAFIMLLSNRIKIVISNRYTNQTEK